MGSEFPALVVLTTADLVGETVLFLCVKTREKVIISVKPKCLGHRRQGDDLHIGDLGDDATMWAIPILVYTISCEFLVYVKNFYELYDEVVHMFDFL